MKQEYSNSWQYNQPQQLDVGPGLGQAHNVAVLRRMFVESIVYIHFSYNNQFDKHIINYMYSESTFRER